MKSMLNKAELVGMTLKTKFIFGLILFALLNTLAMQDVLANTQLNQQRLALLIGNSKYDGLDDLPNARNDLKLMSKKLKSLGFEVKTVSNSSRAKMVKSINEFGQRLNDVDVSLFYYAGHAVQHDNVNYMIPSKGASKINNSSLEYDAVDLSRVISQMRDATAATNIIIMDACRDNPFKSSVRARGLGKTKGLAVPSTNAKGIYIAYSTSPGAVALDNGLDNGRYSPYTEALANYIDKPGLGINDIFTRVRSRVIEKTGNSQVPWEISSLTSDFYFSGEQTDEERENEIKIEAQLKALKMELEAERQAKRQAEIAQQKSLKLLEETKKSSQNQVQEKELTQSALVSELAKLKAELEAAKNEQVDIELKEAARIKLAEKETKAEILKQQLALQAQKRNAEKEQRLRREKELSELRKIEALELEESEKKARLLAKKKEQTERELGVAKKLLEEEKSARKLAEEKANKRAQQNSEAALAAELRLKELLAQQEMSLQKAAKLEALRQEQVDLEKAQMLAKIAEGENLRIEQEKQAKEALAAASQAERTRFEELFKRLEQEEAKRKEREKQLVVAMVKNCDDLLKNASQGSKVLKCYNDVLSIDKDNNAARKGLARLERAYQKLIAKSLKQERLGKVDREYAILEEINPEKAAKKYQKSVERLRKKYVDIAEGSSKRVLPTF